MVKSTRFARMDMARSRKRSSISLTCLFLLSVVVSLALPASTVMASNETTEGTITGTETWAGTHTLTGDVTIAPGAKLIIHAGSTVTFPNGTHLDVRGSLCAGSSSCGSPTNAGPAMKITLRWNEPENSSATGECYGMSQGNQEIWIDDPSCNEGILMRSSIDLSQTELRHVTFDGAWGVPHYITAVSEFRYGALVLDGASPVLTELEFNDINTSSILTTNLAQPTFNGGNFVVGNDESRDIVGPALQIYSSGSSISPFVLSDITLAGTANGCQQNQGGRPTIWAEKSFIEIDNAEITSGDYGVYFASSAGSLTNSEINVNCNGVDVNGKKSVGSTFFGTEISGNQINTVQRTGIFAASSAYVTISNNEIQGAAEGSGIAVSSSQAFIHNNNIGPIEGFNGFWFGGSFDVVAENNSIFQTARTPIVAGWYTQSYASASRVFLANNTISYDGTGACSSNTHWGGDFTCPVLHAYMTGVTMYDNVINAGGTADGIRSVGSLLDIQRNTFTVSKTGAVIRNFDSGSAGSQQYGSLGFFSQNTWDGVDVTYNVTMSSVTAQSEYIPSPQSGESPVKLSWPDQEPRPQNGFQGALLPTPVKECQNCDNMTPRNFPLAVNMDNNSTIFTFANLTNLDLSKVQIGTTPTRYAVQVSRAELVRFQTLINGERVSDATVVIEDALGNDLYAVETGSDGYTPWVALPSNFHLDFRGLEGGDNPDGFADDEYEDSCSDGIDNDGDLLVDTEDDSCDYSAGTREMSLYRYTAFRFGFGYSSTDEFILQETTHQETINLVNLPPTVIVTQQDGESFRRIVNITGSAHDGQLANSYATDQLAQWDQRGYVHSIQVKDPFTGSWEDAGLAVDTSGTQQGQVTRLNRPFSSWYYEIDLSSLAGDGDYIFEFRAFDGIDYSPVVSRSVKLNTQPPTIMVSTPASFTYHDEGVVSFSGSAQDPYGCPENCNSDVGLIWIEMAVGDSDGDGESDFLSRTPVQSDGTGNWAYDWDFTSMPRELATFTITIWASDSDFCIGEIDECQPVVLTLSIDNSNSQPTISVNEPYSGSRISSSSDSLFKGVARDFDGQVTRVDVEVMDVFYDFTTVFTSSTNEFSEEGEWEIEWDSTILRHDAEYLIRIRSYDGLDYSSVVELLITADNPPDAGNNQPVFDPSGWKSEITLYCDEQSSSRERCTTATIDLRQFVSDLDNDIEFISVYNDTSSPYDDLHALVIVVGNDGIARYNPADMMFYQDDMSQWSLYDVIFVATDANDSKISTNAVTFDVITLEFTIFGSEEKWVFENEIVYYSGLGLPGKQVTISLDGLPVNSTIVGEDGTWELGVLASRIEVSAVPEFTYSGQTLDVGRITIGEQNKDETNWGLMGILAIVSIAGLAALAFVLGFISFEIDEDDEMGKTPASLSGMSPDEPINNPAESNLERFEDHPGWLWDPNSEEWIPDPEFQE